MKNPEAPADIVAHLGDDYDRYLGAIVPPLFQNTLFTRKKQQHGYTYTRINNSTLEILEKKLAALEHAPAACTFASGMGAISALLASLLKAGDHVLALSSIYYPTADFLKTELAKYGVTTTFLNHFTPEEIRQSLRPETKLFYLESPSSNIFRILPLREIAACARARGAVTVIDNTWASPLYQKPLELGIDFSLHSASKYIGGHSDVVGGVVLGSVDAVNGLRMGQRASWGACMDPFSAWLLIRSLRTLELRMARHSDTGMKVAQFLNGHPRIRRVFYPGLPSFEGHEIANSQMTGFTGLMSFVPDCPPEKITKLVKSLDVFEEGPSWGGFESVANTPGLSTDRSLLDFQGIPKGLVRISVGLEDADTLIADLDRALNAMGKI
ncbi:MAG: trans-sulfuration enzyme family protein [Oscillospiraceae bacterium]